MLVGISEDITSWSTSPYSSFLRICTKSTLHQLRLYWKRYVQCDVSLKEKQVELYAQFTQEYRSRFEGSSLNYTASRAAGIFWMDALDALSSNFKRYWTTGTINPDPSSAKTMNPTFIYSITGEGCAVHYGTYPLQSFHLASAVSSAQLAKKPLRIEDLIACAMHQFQAWCNSFRKTVLETSPGRITIRIFAGDALSFCQTLNHHAITSSKSAALFTSPWASAELVLDGGDYDHRKIAPINFDVIDTSNIMDHVGLLNVLIAATPLLSYKHTSALYTETLVLNGQDAANSFVQQLCASIPAMSLLIGIAPLAYLSGFTTHSNTHEIMTVATVKGRQYYERVAWKVPYLGDQAAVEQHQDLIRPTWDPSQLAKLLFDIYYHIFIDEDLNEKFKSFGKPGGSIIHYHRGTFSAFLGLVKSRTSTNWVTVMERIFDMLHTDRRLICNSNGYQELCCQLHINNVYSVEIFRPGQELPIDRSSGKFCGWPSVPPLVCLSFVIPREKLKLLENLRFDQIGSPMLECHIRGEGFDNIFSCIQFTFGRVSASERGSDAHILIDEDAAGWSGTSSLIASLWVSSHMLATRPSSITVGLGIHPTFDATRALASKLGILLKIYSARLMDDGSVFVTRERPQALGGAATSTIASEVVPLTLPSHSSQSTMVTLDKFEPTSMTMKWNNLHISPQVVAEAIQTAPCTMALKLGPKTKNFTYPFPIDGSRSRIRIARKSGWIEVSYSFKFSLLLHI